MEAEKRMRDLQHNLYQFSNELEDIYYQMKKEVSKETTDHKEYVENYNKKLDKYYNETSNSKFEKMIYKKLPLIFRIFKVNIYIHGKRLDTKDSCIRVNYSFDRCNKGFNRFCYEFWVNDFENNRKK